MFIIISETWTVESGGHLWGEDVDEAALTMPVSHSTQRGAKESWWLLSHVAASFF
jgi:hypothetical protein